MFEGISLFVFLFDYLFLEVFDLFDLLFLYRFVDQVINIFYCELACPLSSCINQESQKYLEERQPDYYPMSRHYAAAQTNQPPTRVRNQGCSAYV